MSLTDSAGSKSAFFKSFSLSQSLSLYVSLSLFLPLSLSLIPGGNYEYKMTWIRKKDILDIAGMSRGNFNDNTTIIVMQAGGTEN